MFEKIESIISIIPTGIVVVDENKKIQYMNPYARDMLIGKESFNNDITSLHREKYEKRKIEEYFSNLKTQRNVELPIVKVFDFKDNKQSLFVVKLTKIYNSNDEFAGIVAIFYDMSSLTLSKVYDKNKKPLTVINKLPVITDNKMVFLNTDEIVFIKSVGSSSLIFDMDGLEYYSNLKISELENRLENKGFFRSHKSYIANLSYLRELRCDEGECQILLKAIKEFTIPLSRRNKFKLNKILSVS